MSGMTESIRAVEAIANLAQEALQSLGDSGGYKEVERYITARLPAHLQKVADRVAVLEVMQFLTRLAPSVFKTQSAEAVVDLSKADLIAELSWQYGIAKEMLTTASSGLDNEDKLKTLKAAGTLLEQATKLRERLLNIAAVEEFQRAVFEILDETAPGSRDKILDRLEGIGRGSDQVSPAAGSSATDDAATSIPTSAPPLSRRLVQTELAL